MVPNGDGLARALETDNFSGAVAAFEPRSEAHPGMTTEMAASKIGPRDAGQTRNNPLPLSSSHVHCLLATMGRVTPCVLEHRLEDYDECSDSAGAKNLVGEQRR